MLKKRKILEIKITENKKTPNVTLTKICEEDRLNMREIIKKNPKILPRDLIKGRDNAIHFLARFTQMLGTFKSKRIIMWSKMTKPEMDVAYKLLMHNLPMSELELAKKDTPAGRKAAETITNFVVKGLIDSGFKRYSKLTGK